VVQEARQEGQPEQEKFGAEAGLWDSCQVLAHFPMEVSNKLLHFLDSFLNREGNF
jgi:hypothetical protein